jgi:hypothetical protein
MLVDVKEVQYRGGHRLFLRFEDGLSGEVGVARLVPFTGVLASLRDEKEFAKVELYPDGGTIRWPSGADLAPETLYEAVAKASAAS